MIDEYFFYNKVYNILFQYLKRNKFCGYDNYDAANTKFFNNKNRNKLIGLAWGQFHLYFPINIRPSFGIKPTIDNQGSALIIQALMKHKINNTEGYIKELINYIYEKSLKKKYGKHCWNGHNYPIQTLIDYQRPDVPGVIGTEACASAFFEYYIKYRGFHDVIIDVKKFFLDDLLTKYGNIHFIKYKPTTLSHLLNYNASAIAFSYLLRYNNYFECNSNNKINDLTEKFFSYLISRQKNDGSWYYSINLNTNFERKQIDFHQGFILDALYDFIYFAKPSDKKYYKSLVKGAEFYKNQQFYANGVSKYRLSRIWPIDIHNQAQGIITFAKLSKIKPEYLKISKTIANWTLMHMRDKKLGYFYYQKWPFLINKICYIRWGQAWMMNALAVLLETLKNEN